MCGVFGDALISQLNSAAFLGSSDTSEVLWHLLSPVRCDSADAGGCMDAAVTARIWRNETGERELHSPLYSSPPHPRAQPDPMALQCNQPAPAAPPGPGEVFEHLHPAPMPGALAWISRDTRWWWGICPSGTCEWVSPTHPHFRSARQDALSSALPPCSPELATAVWAVNLNHLILLNYFPNDVISPVHINDQFHVLFLALF